MPIAVSVVIPAYNEEARLPTYLAAVKKHFDGVLPANHEIIVVDDGSVDGLVTVLQSLRANCRSGRFQRHPENQGKGAAIRTGILSSQGRFVLFCDADGACPIEYEMHLRGSLEAGADLAIGSRAMPGSIVTRAWYRNCLGRAFAWVVRNWFALTVQDTQCGFKMLRRDVALELCSRCREPGYLFDVELLCWAQKLGYRIKEVPVSWRDVPGSKVRLFRDGSKMLFGLWRLWRLFRRANDETPKIPVPEAIAPITVSAVNLSGRKR